MNWGLWTLSPGLPPSKVEGCHTRPNTGCRHPVEKLHSECSALSGVRTTPGRQDPAVVRVMPLPCDLQGQCASRGSLPGFSSQMCIQHYSGEAGDPLAWVNTSLLPLPAGKIQHLFATSPWISGAQEGVDGVPQNQVPRAQSSPHSKAPCSLFHPQGVQPRTLGSPMTPVQPPLCVPVASWSGLWVPSTTLSTRKEDSAGTGNGGV